MQHPERAKGSYTEAVVVIVIIIIIIIIIDFAIIIALIIIIIKMYFSLSKGTFSMRHPESAKGSYMGAVVAMKTDLKTSQVHRYHYHDDCFISITIITSALKTSQVHQQNYRDNCSYL